MSIRTTVALLSLALLSSSQLFAQEQTKKYRFNEDHVLGDVFVREINLSEGTDVMAVRSDQQTLGPLTDVHRHHLKYKESILAADTQGPSSVRRVYLTARAQDTKEMGGTPASTTQVLQGKTVLAQRKGGKLVITSVTANGAKAVKLPAAALREITEDLQADAARYFPDRELSKGEEWSTPLPGLEKILSTTSRMECNGRVEEESTFKGHPCVRVSVTADIAGKSSGGDVTLSLGGDIFYALDMQRIIQSKLSGPVTFKKTEMQGGMEIKLDGQGVLDYTDTVQYLQVAGKPAPGAP